MESSPVEGPLQPGRRLGLAALGFPSAIPESCREINEHRHSPIGDRLIRPDENK